MKLLLFNNHIIMIYSDDDSELSEAPTTAINPFIIAAKSVASTKIVKHIRNTDSRRSVIPKNLYIRISSPKLVQTIRTSSGLRRTTDDLYSFNLD